jgi:hypothetical protein
MDKTQLITIAISALAGAVAKSLVAWIVSIVKTTRMVKAITARIKIVSSKANRKIFFSALSVISYALLLAYFVTTPTPATRLAVLAIVVLVLFIMFETISLLWHISVAINRKTKQPHLTNHSSGTGEKPPAP